MAALPQRMSLPCVTFSPGDLAACGDEGVARQVCTSVDGRVVRVLRLIWRPTVVNAWHSRFAVGLEGSGLAFCLAAGGR